MQVSEPVAEYVASKVGRLYETDFCAWAVAQGQALRDRSWDDLDIENLIEEIEALARQQRQELRNRLAVLLGHLLKWEFQVSRRSRSWQATIRIQRREIELLLKENPSLKPYRDEALGLAYPNGRDLAISETDLPERTFPIDCPYGWDAVLDADFWPGEGAIGE
jgi:Domain of unknown function DUF29